MNDHLSNQISKLLEKLNEEKTVVKSKSVLEKLWDGLNSKLFLAVVGAIFVSFITSNLQEQIAENKAIAERIREDRAIKIEVMTAFANEMSRWMSKSQNVIKRSSWISKSKYDEDRLFPDGRNYRENVLLYEKQKNDLEKITAPAALCTRVKAFFKSKNIQVAADDFLKTTDKYIKSESKSEYNDLYKQTQNKYESMIQLMSIEVNDDTIRTSNNRRVFSFYW